MEVCSLTDIGIRREMNQDYFYSSEDPVGALPNLFIVADGMGGHSAGDLASRHVVEVMTAVIQKTGEGEPADILQDALRQANESLRAYADTHPEKKGMGTTVVAAVLEGHRLTVMNIGDSRLYLVGKEEIRQISEDHSLVQEMVRRGEIDEEIARIHPDRNIITRAVGTGENSSPDIFHKTLQAGDRVLLCTDGLTNMVEDSEILDILNGPGTLVGHTEYLVELANKHGGKDNITVIVVDPEFER
ncbi:MAG: Stp1/IreP family PP2C-type Ser/Thr phosphatase [Clostridiales bacterium]|nr:Stp1/IreP family PP2C-type Ser/Thr phosphatase [Clostridiales bacterium]